MASNKEKSLNRNQGIERRSRTKTLNTKNIRKESTNHFSSLKKLSVTPLYTLLKLSTPIMNNLLKSTTIESHPHLSATHTFKAMKSSADHKINSRKRVSTQKFKNLKESVITEKLSHSQKAITNLRIDIPKTQHNFKTKILKTFYFKNEYGQPYFGNASFGHLYYY